MAAARGSSAQGENKVPPWRVPCRPCPSQVAGGMLRGAGSSGQDQELLPALRKFPAGCSHRQLGELWVAWGWATGPLSNLGTCRTIIHGHTEPSLTFTLGLFAQTEPREGHTCSKA